MKFDNNQINQISQNLYEIKKRGKMRVDARFYASDTILKDLMVQNDPLQQLINVAHLPGILEYALAMPDIHWGYGFPIGGVAATDWQEGVVSPGGVGYDINCGVRLAATNISREELNPLRRKISQALFEKIPTGVGSSHAIRKLSLTEMQELITTGVSWVVNQGYGREEDIAHTEDSGFLPDADPGVISPRAWERGRDQLGTLGSGNHFLELSYIDKIYDAMTAESLALVKEQVVMLIHSGSRGFGYQICEDSLKLAGTAARKYGIELPDRQLACAPIQSPEGKQYLAAMAGAANFAWCNRQVIMSLAEASLQKALQVPEEKLGLRLIYDICHNIAKKEDHIINSRKRTVCVHRKGATRAFAAGNMALPKIYQKTGQPVLVPGDMGRYSFLCMGTQGAERETFGSSCHGAGRLLSRRQAKRLASGRNLIRELAEKGISLQARGHSTVAEEMPDAYKDVSDVVEVMQQSGILKKVARFKPIVVIKG